MRTILRIMGGVLSAWTLFLMASQVMILLDAEVASEPIMKARGGIVSLVAAAAGGDIFTGTYVSLIFLALMLSIGIKGIKGKSLGNAGTAIMLMIMTFIGLICEVFADMQFISSAAQIVFLGFYMFVSSRLTLEDAFY